MIYLDHNATTPIRPEVRTAMLPFLQFVDRRPETMRAALWQQYRRYARAGLTTIGMPGMFTPLSMLDVFEDIAASADAPIRNVAYLRHFQIDSVETFTFRRMYSPWTVRNFR